MLPWKLFGNSCPTLLILALNDLLLSKENLEFKLQSYNIYSAHMRSSVHELLVLLYSEWKWNQDPNSLWISNLLWIDVSRTADRLRDSTGPMEKAKEVHQWNGHEQRRAHPAFHTEMREYSWAADQESDFYDPHL